VVLNILYYFTDPDDLVVDPFGGSGTTLDACRHLGRRCLIYDLKPARDGIIRHDISLGFPKEAKGCDLVFLDPPYWRQKRANYTKEEGSFSEVNLEEFDRKIEKLIHDCHDTVKPGGTVALLIQNTTELGGEMSRMGRYYADHVLDGYNFFIKTGFNPVQRINIPLTWEQFAGFDIKEAREKKRLLGVVRDLLIMKKGDNRRK
jgi:DNA modification methylase